MMPTKPARPDQTLSLAAGRIPEDLTHVRPERFLTRTDGIGNNPKDECKSHTAADGVPAKSIGFLPEQAG